MNFLEDQESVLKDVTERFEHLGIPYMLTGSMAMVGYGVPRMTNDIDIVLEVSLEDAEKLIKEFENDYYLPVNRVSQAIMSKFMFNLIHQQKVVKIDCVIKKEDDFQKNAFSHRQRVRFTDFEVWIISCDDLILSKLNWAKKSCSEMQMRDVGNLMRNGYNREYVELWAEKLGIKELLEDCRKLLEQNYVDGHDS